MVTEQECSETHKEIPHIILDGKSNLYWNRQASQGKGKVTGKASVRLAENPVYALYQCLWFYIVMPPLKKDVIFG